MKKIYELLQQRSKKGDFGIEIEAEGVNLPVKDFKYWIQTNDPSLRGVYPESCCEYVLGEPVLYNEVKSAITELTDAAKEVGTQFKFSFRCSTHVHLNVQTLTEPELYSLIYLYLILEEPLMNFCGKERKHNRFCLRLQDAEYLLVYVNDLVKRGVIKSRPEEGNLRYSALNLASIHKYGSIEFRGMRGTLDLGTLSNWTTALYKLRAAAKKFGTIEAVYDAFINSDTQDFFNTVFEECAPILQYPQLIQDVRMSFSLSLEIPFNHKQNLLPRAGMFQQDLAPPFPAPPFPAPPF